MAKPKQKRGLGRGLESLLSAPAVSTQAETTVAKAGDSTIPASDELARAAATSVPDAIVASCGKQVQLRNLPIDLMQRGEYQPRRDMDLDALTELSESIKARGVIQPIVVRPVANNQYEIIAGERRWRAAQMAGLESVPVLVRAFDDRETLAVSLIENIQREDLNPMEEAMALQRFVDEFEMTHQEAADAVGKSRTTVTNLLRLMALENEVKRLLENGDLEMGHARALLSLGPRKQVMAAKMVVAKGLSVRETERLVRQLLADKAATSPASKVDPDIQRLEKTLSEKLGVSLAIQHTSKGQGKLVIKYNSVDELEGVLAHIRD